MSNKGKKKSNRNQEFLWLAGSNFMIILPCEFQDLNFFFFVDVFFFFGWVCFCFLFYNIDVIKIKKLSSFSSFFMYSDYGQKI